MDKKINSKISNIFIKHLERPIPSTYGDIIADLEMMVVKAHSQGYLSGLRKAVEVVKKSTPSETERIKNWDLEEIGNAMEGVLVELEALKEGR